MRPKATSRSCLLGLPGFFRTVSSLQGLWGRLRLRGPLWLWNTTQRLLQWGEENSPSLRDPPLSSTILDGTQGNRQLWVQGPGSPSCHFRILKGPLVIAGRDLFTSVVILRQVQGGTTS